MATSHSTLPLSVVDDMNALNGALAAYQELMTAYITLVSTDGPSSDGSRFAAGCHSLLQPVLDGYQDIASKVESFCKLGAVSVASTAEVSFDEN